MVQIARPNADSFRSGWEEDDGTTTTIFDQINESVANNDTFIRTPIAPTSAHTYVCKLSSLEDPLSSAGHVVRYTYAKDAAAGSQINLAVQLRLSWRSTTELGTLVSSETHTDISDTITSAARTLSAGEADSITSYGDLYLLFIPSQV